MQRAKQKTILLVEDELLIAMAEARQLEGAGYKVVHAASGEAAVKAAGNPDEAIDLVLMDINLGKGMDGTEAAVEIQKFLDIPVLFLSSHTEKEIVQKTESITNYGYVVKNSSITVLDASIKMAFRLFDAYTSIQGQKMEIEAAYEEMQVSNEELLQTQQDLLEHANALDESERTFRSLFEKGPIGTAYHRMVYDHAGKPVDYIILDANPAYEEMTGIMTPAGKRVTELFPGIEKDPFDWIGTYGEVARSGKELRFEQHLEWNDRWYEIVVYRNKPDHFVTVFFETTAQKRAEGKIAGLLREKELILKEVQHRIKNNMDLLSSILRLQSLSQKDKSVSAALEDAISRVSSMMVLYDKLYRSEDAGTLSLKDYLPALGNQIVGNFQSAVPIALETAIDDIGLDVKVITSIGIIVNELVTNSMKYAFAGRSSGRISIGVSTDGGRVTLAYADDGVGLPDAAQYEKAKGFGMQLVAMLVDQLEGELAVDGRDGARFTIGFNAVS